MHMRELAARAGVTTLFASASVLVAQCAVPPAWAAHVATPEPVVVIEPDGSGGLYAGGYFTTIGGTAAARVAHWNGVAWQALGSGLGGGVASVSALLPTSAGQLVVGGSFSTAGGAPAANIASWNGAQWSPLGTGIGGFLVRTIVEMPNGDLVVGGNFSMAGGVPANNIARWNGSSWSALGPGIGSPGGLLLLASGDLLAGGSITGVTGFVGRWNGATWSSVGNLASMVPNAFAELANGDLIAGGYQTVQRWNGTTWSVAGALGGGNLTTAYDLVRHPDGSTIVVGGFSTVTAGATTAVRGVARLDPVTLSWSDVGSSQALTPLGLAGLVGDVAVLDDGRILLCQAPPLLGGPPVSVIEIAPGCAPLASISGAGCTSPAGNHTLTATTLPWVDNTFRATGSGLPAPSYVLAVYGFSSVVPALPIDSVFLEALPGCNLHVTPDAIETLFTATGTVQSQVFLPNVPPLVGVSFYHQMIPVVVDAQLQPLAITATNALRLTAGSY